MNATFKIIWSHAVSAWVIVSELANNSKGKRVVSRRLSRSASLGCALLSFAGFISIAQATDVQDPAHQYNGGIFATYGYGSQSSQPYCNVLSWKVANQQNYSYGANGESQDNWGRVRDSFKYYGLKTTCGFSDAATQQNRILVWANDDNSNAVNMTVGGKLYANTAAYLNNATINNLTLTGDLNIPYFSVTSSQATGTASGAEAIAIGMGSTNAGGESSIAIGNGALASGQNSIAQSKGSVASGLNAIALGVNSEASSSEAVAMGSDAKASGIQSTAMGASAAAASANSTAIGYGASAGQDGSVALGASSTTAAVVATVSGSINGTSYTYAGTEPVSTVSVGAAGKERTVTNVAAGRVSASSTDAVNGSQLSATNVEIGKLGETIDGIQSGTSMKYLHVNSDGAESVATGADSVAIGAGAVAGQAMDVAVGFGASSSAVSAVKSVKLGDTTYNFAGGAPIGAFSVGAVGAERQIQNVAAGRLSADSTDAVNGSQLFATNTEVGSVGTKVKEVGDQITTINTTIQNLQDGKGVKYVNTNSTGDDSQATGADSTAIGAEALASGDGAVALGTSSKALGINSLALGSGSSAAGGNSVAQGNGAAASGLAAVAQGAFASAAGGNSVAQGSLAQANGADAVAIGSSSNAASKSTVAIGSKATANFTGDVALGDGSVTESTVATSNGVLNGRTYSYAGAAPVSTVSVGAVGNERTITNVAAGRISASSTDAVNGSQLYATNVEVGRLGETIEGIQGGDGIKYMHVNSEGADSVAIGAESVAIGAGAVAGQTMDVAVGSGASSSAVSAVNSVQLGGTTYNFAGVAPIGAFSVGAIGAERQIQNVAAGRLSVSSTDAVNGSQLYSTNQQVQQNSSNITLLQSSVTLLQASAGPGGTNGTDGAANASSTSTVVQPGGVVIGNNGTSVSVGTNAAASNTSTTAMGTNSQASGLNATAVGSNAQAAGAGSVAIGSGSKAEVTNSVAIGQGSVANRENSVSVGSTTNQRQITNVAAGTARTDAVNLGQLEDGLSGVADWSSNYTDARVGQVDRRASGGVAAAMAMATLPQAYQPNQRAAGVSLSSFRGEQAMAIGVSTISDSGRYLFKLNASANTGGDAGVAVGAGIVW
ncbi:YadA-like family protein [Xanthomonas citri]|uniref:YadA-like family protein n=1 Tax=Xanthomonas citri TaxID=346 RepID=UPI0009B7335B|nr:YadA-like family protein [Xanthomonas citri]